MNRRIVVSAYLSGVGQEKKVACLERLDPRLRSRGYELFLVNTAPAPLASSIKNVTIPYCIDYAARIVGSKYLTEEDIDGGVREAASVEAAIRNSPLLTAAIKVIFYREFMRRVLLRHKPALCLIWHQFNGLHRGLRSLCQELEVPYLYAEYGNFPGTLALDTEGQMGESWVARRPEEFSALPVDEKDMKVAGRLIEKIRDQKRSRKDQSDEVPIDEIISRRRAQGRKIIFYAGQNDPQTGIVPRNLPESKIHSPIYDDTFDALNHMTELAAKNNWHVLFKPHPMVERKQANFKVSHPDRFDYAIGANIFECMDQTDATATIVSQLSYLALIHRRPSIQLGRTQLSGKGCAYEPASREDVEEVLRRALNDGPSEAREELWVKHVAQMCKYYLFSLEPDLEEIIGRDCSEAADFLISKVPEDTDDDRWSRLERDQRGVFGRDCGDSDQVAQLTRLYRRLRLLNVPLRPLLFERNPGAVRTFLLGCQEVARFSVKKLVGK